MWGVTSGTKNVEQWAASLKEETKDCQTMAPLRLSKPYIYTMQQTLSDNNISISLQSSPIIDSVLRH